MARQPIITIVCGRRGVGKSVETIDIAYRYVSAMPKRKALIFDVNDEFGSFKFKDFDDNKKNYHSIKTLRIQDIARFTAQKIPEIRRIRPYWDNGKRMTTGDMSTVLSIILNNYKDGLLLVEDANKYTSSNLGKDLIGSLATIRQAGIDLIIQYQMIKRAAHPTLVGMANFFRIHDTFDTPYRKEISENLADNYEIISICYEMVQVKKMKGVKYYCVYADMENKKVKGKFTNEDIKQSIEMFLRKNQTEIRAREKEVDRKGNKIYKNYEQAYNSYEKELLERYF